MAFHEPTPLLSPLTTLLSRDLVEGEGQRLGVFKRAPRKVDLYILVWTLILGLPAGSKKRTLDGLRVAYQEATGHTLARSSFYDRLNKPLAKLMKALVNTLLGILKPPSWLAPSLTLPMCSPSTPPSSDSMTSSKSPLQPPEPTTPGPLRSCTWS